MNYQDLINSKPVVLVEFYATWCPHCRAMMPVVEQIKELLEGQVEVAQLDIDLNEEAAETEDINGTPTFILYKNGRQVWRESGEMEGQYLLSTIQSYL
ncbi:MAG: thioredoxin family protein [Muribaculum sp.]|nr:thioredoxin family protein [Muribaculum sp.]